MIFVLSGLNVQVLRYCIICLVLKSPNPGWWCVGLGVIGRANFVPIRQDMAPLDMCDCYSTMYNVIYIDGKAKVSAQCPVCTMLFI